MNLESIIKVVHSPAGNGWARQAEEALKTLTHGNEARYPQKAKESFAIRAPEMRDSGVPFAALIHPSNPSSGAYGGMSFVLFPVEEGPCMVALVVGTQGLSPDEEVLGRPGHARKAKAIVRWLNNTQSNGIIVAWAKPDPTRTDESVPANVRQAFSEYESVFNRYGKEIYAFYRPNEDQKKTEIAIAAFLDLAFAERSFDPLTASKSHKQEIVNGWMAHLLPSLSEETIVNHLANHRFVILAGPPGTGKTRAALRILKEEYRENGSTIQFHPNTTYENFVGGLAPEQTSGAMGFSFVPRAGDLMRAAHEAREIYPEKYLLHIDEINRADLAKVLGEALFLLEAKGSEPRFVKLAYEFSEIHGSGFDLPDNLHILGTMNTSDRSIAIVDVAVRRRFAFLHMWPDAKVVHDNGGQIMQEAFATLLSIFVEYATDDAFEMLPGHSYFLEKDNDRAMETLKATLAPLLEEYLSQGYTAGFAGPIQAYLQWIESL